MTNSQRKTMSLLWAVAALCAALLMPVQSAFAEATPPVQTPAITTESTASAAPAETPEPEPVAGWDSPLDVTLSNGAATAWRLSDGNPNSRVSFKESEWVAARRPENAAALRLTWLEPAAGTTVQQADASGRLLASRKLTEGFYDDVIDLEEACVSVAVLPEGKTALSELSFLNAEERAAYPDAAHPEKADLMLIAAHTGDESLYFGSILPTYAGEVGMETLTVYLSHDSPRAQQDAIRAQRLCGETNEPLFLNLRYRLLVGDDIPNASKYWRTQDTIEQLVEWIRRYRPEVVVTHSLRGEENEGMHAWTAELARLAAEEAADGEKWKKSAAAYGAWQVKKLYVHAEADAESATSINPQRVLYAFDGATAIEVANKAYEAYTTLRIYRMSPSTEAGYTLAASTVGEDAAHDDLFEHLAAEELTNAGRVAPTPAPSQTPAPTAVLSPAPSAQPETDETKKMTAGDGIRLAILLGGAALTAVLAAVLLRRIKERKGLLAAIALCGAPLLAAVTAFVLLSYTAARQAAEPLLVEAEPSPAVTVESAATPLPTATPEPEHPWAAYFRAEGDPEEVIVFDEAAGHWEYKNDALSIQIDRHSGQTDGRPLAWYTAHIRMRDYDSFRAGFGSSSLQGITKSKPWRIARKYRAVLAITGDNLVNSEKELKGVLIRDGVLYAKYQKQPTMALCENMTMRIYPKGGADAAALLEDGVRNTFGFGPLLVADGSICEDGYRVNIGARNPRCGLGYVEPGHFVAIVVDGRQKDYSIGMRLEPFAQLFLDESCTTAYNLDGGLSAGMMFMGEPINRHRAVNASKFQRPWPDALLWGYSTQVPALDDPVHVRGADDEKAQ